MKSLRRFKHRHGRCYELAAKVMVREPESEGFRLVHGWISQLRFCGDLIEHAWIEVDAGNTVYDRVSDRYFPAEQYSEERRAIPDRRYSHAETMRLIGMARHA